MTRIRFARLAREDLLDIWCNIAARDLSAADRAYDRIEASCTVLADHPRIGPARPDIGAGARVLVIAPWLVLYRVVGEGVQVVRIVDGVRDLTRLRWPDDDAET